jgi:hypothetical protein
MQVVVEMIAAAAMLRAAGGTRLTFPIMTDAAEVAAAFLGEKNVGATSVNDRQGLTEHDSHNT